MSETTEHDTELARLQARVALLEAAFDAAPTPMQIFDKHGMSLRMNAAQQAFLGLPSPEIGVGEFNVLTDPFSVQTGNAPLFARAYTGESVDCPEQEVDLSEAHKQKVPSTTKQQETYTNVCIHTFSYWRFKVTVRQSFCTAARI